jgi:hypothetical protein
MIIFLFFCFYCLVNIILVYLFYEWSLYLFLKTIYNLKIIIITSNKYSIDYSSNHLGNLVRFTDSPNSHIDFIIQKSPSYLGSKPNYNKLWKCFSYSFLIKLIYFSKYSLYN